MAETVEQRKERMAKVRAARGKKKEKIEVPRETKVEDPYEQVDPKIAAQIQDAKEHGVGEIDPAKPETIPPNLFSGFVRRLEFFGDRPGFVRRYFNDDKGGTNIGNALNSGWKMVERKDVQLNAAVTPRNNDLGSHVRQYVGTDETGGPMYAYLMEIPTWLWEKHQEARLAYHNQLRRQIQGGQVNAGLGDKQISAGKPYPGGTANFLPPITVDSKIVR